jgi:hypothetical protein
VLNNGRALIERLGPGVGGRFGGLGTLFKMFNMFRSRIARGVMFRSRIARGVLKILNNLNRRGMGASVAA